MIRELGDGDHEQMRLPGRIALLAADIVRQLLYARIDHHERRLLIQCSNELLDLNLARSAVGIDRKMHALALDEAVDNDRGAWFGRLVEFDDDEVATARSAGFRPARLGPRVLRTETAGIVALAVLQSHWGDLAAASGS